MGKGRFIVFEGIDGTGTTTQSQMLVDRLNREGIPAVLTAEPTDGAIGKLIRRILKREIAASHDALALLFASDRLWHWEFFIKPNLDKGRWVISDRYVLSSIAYQSLYCDPDWVQAINAKAPAPDLTLLLDMDVNSAMARIGGRGNEKEIFEKAEILKKVRESYLANVKKIESKKLKIIDASLSIESVFKNTGQTVGEKLKR